MSETSREPAPDLVWRKSSYSAGNGGACVEIAQSPAAVWVRDSKDPGGPVLAFNRAEWSAFLAGTQDDEFDL